MYRGIATATRWIVAFFMVVSCGSEDPPDDGGTGGHGGSVSESSASTASQGGGEAVVIPGPDGKCAGDNTVCDINGSPGRCINAYCCTGCISEGKCWGGQFDDYYCGDNGAACIKCAPATCNAAKCEPMQQ